MLQYLRLSQVGLGTDVAGGHSCSMLDCIRQTLIATNVCGLQPDEDGNMWNPLRCGCGCVALGAVDAVQYSSLHGSQINLTAACRIHVGPPKVLCLNTGSYARSHTTAVCIGCKSMPIVLCAKTAALWLVCTRASTATPHHHHIVL